MLGVRPLLKIEETSGRLVIRDNPALFWGFASLFVLSGSACVYLGWTTTPDLLSGAIASVIGFGHLAGAVYMLWSEPASAVELDMIAGRATIRRWGISGRRTERIALSEVAGAEVEVGEHSEGGPIYRPVLLLRTGEHRPVSLFWYQRQEPSAAVAERLRQALQMSTKSKQQ